MYTYIHIYIHTSPISVSYAQCSEHPSPSQPSRSLHISLPLVSFFNFRNVKTFAVQNMTHYTNNKLSDGKHFMSAKLVPE